MPFLFRIFLTASSLCLIFAVFLAGKQSNLIAKIHPALSSTPILVSYVAYFLVAVAIAWVSLFFARYLESDTISQNSLSVVESANDVYLPVYLGYFFVALSTQDYTVFAFVFGIIYVFTFYSGVTYFNPMYCLFRYRFYYAINQKNIKVLLITRQVLKDPASVNFNNVKRINDFTFIEV
jgi:hypothetical protein